MNLKANRKLVVNVAAIVLGIGLLVILYRTYLRTYVTQWREARTELNARKTRLGELRKAFGNQRDPKDELKTLKEEVKNLTDATQSLQKLKTVGMETRDLPADLHDPDEEIRRELYRDYMKNAMETSENMIKDRLKQAKILPPNLQLYTQLEDADEAAYYTNRARGLQGIVNALAKTRAYGGNLLFEELKLQNYEEGKRNREGAVNILTYSMKMTMDTSNLVAFIYNLQEEDTYYYFKNMKISPRGAGRSGGGGGGGGGGQQLTVETTIATTMIFESQVKAQVEATAQALKRSTLGSSGGGGGKGLAALFAGMQQQMTKDEEYHSEKKWWEFWKWFKK